MLTARVSPDDEGSKGFWGRMRGDGAGSGSRTRTVLPPLDFESSASANSAIPAARVKKCFTMGREGKRESTLPRAGIGMSSRAKKTRNGATTPRFSTKLVE